MNVKIAEVRVTPIAIADPPLLNAGGIHAPYALRTVVELVTDGGVSGVGEVPGRVETTAALERARELLVGRSPFRLSTLIDELRERFCRDDDPEAWPHGRLMHVAGAVEVACLDVIGKETGRPVVDLLGGAARERVPFSAYLFFKREGAGGGLGYGTDRKAEGWARARQAEALGPEGIVAQAEAMCSEFGFRSLKVKGGALPPPVEASAIRALRDAFGPAVPLRLDPNAVWSLRTAVRWGRRLEGLLEYYEDPVRGQLAMARLRRRVRIPLATNMCTTRFEHMPGSLALGSEDVILVDHHGWGGLRASVELGRMCRTFGRGLSMHSNSHLGISLAAMVHLGAAVPNLTYALDTHYPWQSEEILAGGRIKFEDGSVAVPKGPGLGVELDRQALARAERTYRACGLTHRDDEAEMRKLDPSWRFQQTRW